MRARVRLLFPAPASVLFVLDESNTESMLNIALALLAGSAAASPIVQSTRWKRNNLAGLDFEM